MAKFTVYESAEVTRVQTWEYEVEAETAEDALQLVKDGTADDGVITWQSDYDVTCQGFGLNEEDAAQERAERCENALH